MPDSILNGKSILAVDDEPDVLTVLGEEIKEVYPDSRFDKAKTYEEAVERMISLTYDVVILDIMGVRGFDLLELAVSRNFPVDRAAKVIHRPPLPPQVRQGTWWQGPVPLHHGQCHQ